MNPLAITLFDDADCAHLQPLTLSRSAADCRWGILTIREKWEKATGLNPHIHTAPYLQALYGVWSHPLKVNSRVLPSSALIDAIAALKPGEALYCKDLRIAIHGNEENQAISFEENLEVLRFPWDLFSHNHRELKRDFELITHNRVSAPLDSSNRVIGSHPVFLEEGAQAMCAIFNTTEGPVYIGKNAEVQEGCLLRGPFSLGDFSQLKMGARIYTGTTIGPHCKVGGEVNNSVIFGYSNKAHEGFLGNAVIGEWCNLGADTNNSNLKNNYAEVKVWSYPHNRFVATGLQFCGLIMGDHSKSGINTMFNTGTVVGFSSNIFGSGFPRNFIPSFTWGGAGGTEVYTVKKALETAEKVMNRRGIELDNVQKEIFQYLFDLTYENKNQN